MMRKIKRLSVVAAAVVTAVTSMVSVLNVSAEEIPGSQNTTMRDITVSDLVKDMGIGINLGNTFEAINSWTADPTVSDFETAWGSPIVTKEMIQGYADAGFGVLRVPVAWSNMMEDDGTYTINADYLARVKEVINWALDSDLYVIMNIHWDGGWWSNFPKEKEECMKKYTRIWSQLSEEFKTYGDYLMFESLNEEGGWGNIKGSESYALLNEINQTFVDLVRASGGNNGERHLLIAGYNTDIQKTCNELFEMPNDPVNRCALSVHYYTPPTFAILEEDASWGTNRTTWGTDEDFAELQLYMDMVKEKFVDNGVPVILGEFGCPTKNKEADSVRLYLSSVCNAAFTRDICPVLWDTPNNHYNRPTATMKDSQLVVNFAAIKAGTYLSDEPIDSSSDIDSSIVDDSSSTDESSVASAEDSSKTDDVSSTTNTSSSINNDKNPSTGNGFAFTAGLVALSAAFVAVKKRKN